MILNSVLSNDAAFHVLLRQRPGDLATTAIAECQATPLTMTKQAAVPVLAVA
jgi:hypothetical protein